MNTIKDFRELVDHPGTTDEMIVYLINDNDMVAPQGKVCQPYTFAVKDGYVFLILDGGLKL